MLIAVDFDGTIVEHDYPAIGKEIPFAIETLKKLQEEGHDLVLWTYRAGKELDEAVDYCKSEGLEFYAVNAAYPGDEVDAYNSRKILADIYIDDRNVGGLPDWGVIYQLITGKGEMDFEMRQAVERKNWLIRLGEKMERLKGDVNTEREQ
ncbi:BT0820 family HAD-type phosphatase [Saccharicrinis sp. FJH2]|uniref:BT0820 family HAD-type phosphatase n=1 Tax=unclassified Saccharicrinis TaxID=2646859 RepID=UPI0035D440D9